MAEEGPTTLLFLHGGPEAVLERSGIERSSFLIRRGYDWSWRICVVTDVRSRRDGFSTERFAENMFEVADHGGAAKLIVVAYTERPLGTVDGLHQAGSRPGPDTIRPSTRRSLG